MQVKTVLGFDKKLHASWHGALTLCGRRAWYESKEALSKVECATCQKIMEPKSVV